MTYTFSYEDRGGKLHNYVYPSEAAYKASEVWWKKPGWKHIQEFAHNQNLAFIDTTWTSDQAFAVCIRWAEIWEEERRLQTERVYEAIERDL